MLTPERYEVLLAMQDGRAFRLWPMMRRAFLRERLIEPDGEYPTPSDSRRSKQPVRSYRVTRRGRAELAAFKSVIEDQRPAVTSNLPMKPQVERLQ